MIAGKNYPLNCGTATTTSFPIAFAKRRILNERIAPSARAVRRSIGGETGSSAVDVADYTTTRRTTSAYVEDAELVAGRRQEFREVEFESRTAGVLSGSSSTTDAGYLFTHVSPGSAVLSCTTKSGLTSSVRATVGSGGSSSSDEWLAWRSGSLGEHIVGQFASRATSGKTMPIYSTKDHGGSIYRRNQSCWAYDVDLSCISPWNTRGGQTLAGTLISPRHILFADHFPIPSGTTIRFVSQPPSAAGPLTVENVTLSAVSADTFGDLRVGLLSADVSAQFCKVIPDDTLDHLPSMEKSKTGQTLGPSLPRLPLISTSQDKDIGYRSLFRLDVGGWGSWFSGVSVSGQSGLQDYDLKPNVRIGCSGHPLFLLIQGELALVGVYFSSGGGGTDFSAAACHSFVNSAMTTLGGGYQLTSFDLSGFPTY